jgi:HK97 family phage prohead protease
MERKELLATPKSYATGTPGSLLTFTAVATCSQRDRDGDVLKSSGAIMDKQMPLLFSHDPRLVVGRVLRTVSRSDNQVVVEASVIDFGDSTGELAMLAKDCATLIRAGALRVSIGFDPLSYRALDEKDGRFLVEKFEVMELSLVAVPSNTGAVVQAITSGKCRSPIIKGYCSGLRAGSKAERLAFWDGAVQKSSREFEDDELMTWLKGEEDEPDALELLLFAGEMFGDERAIELFCEA